MTAFFDAVCQDDEQSVVHTVNVFLEKSKNKQKRPNKELIGPPLDKTNRLKMLALHSRW